MATNTKVALSTLKERVKWMKESKIFTVRAQWHMVKEVEDNPLEYYVHYNDELSEEQISYLEEDGQEGYDKLLESVWDSLFECEVEAKDQQRKEIWDSLDSSDFKEEYLRKVFNEEMDIEKFDEDEVAEYIKIHDASEEFKDILCEYQTYDCNIDEIFSNNRYDKKLWIEMNGIDEFQCYIQDEIERFEKKINVYDLELATKHETVYICTDENIETIDEVIHYAEAIKNKPSVGLVRIDSFFTLEDEDGNEYEIDIDKTIEIDISDAVFMDSDEYREDSYTDIFYMDVVTPTKQNTQKLGYLMTGCAPIGFYDDRDADIQCQIDNFLVIEGVFETAESYEVFGFDLSTNTWMERKLTSVDIQIAEKIKSTQEFNGLLLSIDGIIKSKQTAA